MDPPSPLAHHPLTTELIVDPFCNLKTTPSSHFNFFMWINEHIVLACWIDATELIQTINMLVRFLIVEQQTVTFHVQLQHRSLSPICGILVPRYLVSGYRGHGNTTS